MWPFRRKTLVITHSGTFHADDVFACATLSLLFKNRIKIVRTRDEKIIEKGDIVLDVGGIYDPKENRFDHHQSGGAGKHANGVPYASFGLVWKHYGKELCGSDEIAEAIDESLVVPIDAGDNGVNFTNTEFNDLHPFMVDNAFRSLLSADRSNKAIQRAFNEALFMAKKIIKNQMEREEYKKSKEKSAIEAYNNAPDKRIVILDENIPVGILNKYPEPLFVVVPRQEPNEKTWLILTVRDDPKSFKNRKDFPKAWAGLIGEKLAKVTGVTDSGFCHNNLFLAGAKSREGAARLAELAANA